MAMVPFIRRAGVVAAAVLILGLGPAARSDEPAPPAGVVVQFPKDLTANTAVRLREAVKAPLKRYQAYAQRQDAKWRQEHPFKLLCDFNPEGRADATGDYGVCYDLAKVLLELQQNNHVTTRAYVHGDVSRNAVLPVLACGDIVMSSEPPAHIGPIADSDRPLDEAERAAYATMARDRFPSAIVRKMYERDLAVVKVSPAGPVTDFWVDEKTAAENKLNPVGRPSGLAAGTVAFYDFDQAKEYGLLAKPPAPQNSRDDALKSFGLPGDAASYSLTDPIIANQIKVQGDINGALSEDMKHRLDAALGANTDVLILDLECGGGDDHTAYELGQYIVGLKARNTRKPITTIAYVSNSALDTSTLLALACDEIVMQKGAHLGDFEAYLKEHPDRLEPLRAELKTTAENSYYPPALAEGMADRDLELIQADDGVVWTAQQWANLQRHKPGGAATKIKPAGIWLKLDDAEAVKYGLADRTVKDYNELCTQESIQPTTIEGGWLKALADFLDQPWMSVILVMIGVTCLIIELKMPGASIPGVIAAVCFVLFFWSESQLAGQITWLAVLLFVLGLILIGVEVFVMHGTGFCGISGVLLTVTGLALVAFGKWPQTTEDWQGFGLKLGPFSIGIVVSVILAFVAMRYLKHIPFLNRLILKPPGEGGEDGEATTPEPLQPELASLLGAIGVAATPLRPAGKTQFGEQFVDVVAEGGYVQPGARVQVIEIEGNRVVVKEV
ncbi:MAG TPA: NfeD family protein [Gemmataceae bacterium]|nr:NfeD family protein [Gemmataceae bacterium]